MKKLYCLLFLLLSIVVTSQTTRKYSNEFMNIGVDAKAFGMGNAVVANTNDVNSGYWNPAGILQLKDKQISAMHANYFANIAQYDYIGFAMPIDGNSAWGISLIRFGVDDILNTTQLIDEQGNIDYNRISLFSAADYGFTFSYGRRPTFTEGLTYGFNAKIIRRVIGDFASSWGFGFDAGLQYEKNTWKFGLMLRDITTTFNTWNIDDDIFDDVSSQIPDQELPETTELTLPKAQLGVSKLISFNSNYSLTTEIDLNMRFSKTADIISSSFVSLSPAIGFEFDYTKTIFLRAGVGNFQNVEQFGDENLNFQPNIGIGFNYKGIHIDYALTDIGNQSTAIYSNVFSVKVDWSLFKKKNE